MGEKPQSGGAKFVEKRTTGGSRTGFWSCKQVIVFSRAKVFKAHAVPQGLCASLINALKLLANQQEDGDGLLQNIVTNLGKESRKGLTDGLREFTEVDNERSLDDGALRRGTGTFKVRKPKAPEGSSEVTVRESPDELTSRAEEVNTWKALTSVNHIEPGRWGPPLVDADWCAFCQTLYKGIEGKDWEDMYDSHKVMSRSCGCKKAAGGSEGKSPVGHESS